MSKNFYITARPGLLRASLLSPLWAMLLAALSLCFAPLALGAEGKTPPPEFAEGQAEGMPRAKSVPPAPETMKKPIRLLFTGDIMVHEPQLRGARIMAKIRTQEMKQAVKPPAGQSMEQPQEQAPAAPDTPSPALPAIPDSLPEYDFDHALEEVAPFLKADLLVGNLETTLSGREPYQGYPAFNSPDSLALALKKAGFHVLTLANNHILDQGVKSALRTRDFVLGLGFAVSGIFPVEKEITRTKTNTEQKANAEKPASETPKHPPVPPVFPAASDNAGKKPLTEPAANMPEETPADVSDNIPGDVSGDAAGAPLLLNVRGLRVGILNYTYGTNAEITPERLLGKGLRLNALNRDRVVADIRRLRDGKADIIVACFHWGNEYQPIPSAQQQEAAGWCREEGVDLIVGTHPHILQPVQVWDENGKARAIAWSLGNFVSNQRTLPRERSVLLAVDIVPGEAGARVDRVSVLPLWVESRPVSIGKMSGKTLIVHPAIVPASDVTPKPGQNPDSANPNPEAESAPGSLSANGTNAAHPMALTLQRVGKEVLDFLGVAGTPAEDGFYTVYQRAKD